MLAWLPFVAAFVVVAVMLNLPAADNYSPWVNFVVAVPVFISVVFVGLDLLARYQAWKDR